MKISSIEVKNYKGFADSSELVLGSGFNLVVGQNNSGKTALLEAATLSFKGKPHRSIVHRDTFKKGALEASSVSVTVSISCQELRSALEQGMDLFLPIQDPESLSFGVASAKEFDYLESILSKDSIEFRITVSAQLGKSSTIDEIVGPDWIYGPLAKRYARVRWDDEQKRFFINDSPSTSRKNARASGWSDFAKRMHDSIYHFEAERVDLSWSPHKNDFVLDSNGENLADVLNRLQGRDPSTFHRYNNYIAQIFPSIRAISVVSREDRDADDASNTEREPSRELEILIWPENGHPDRDDLAVPMAESGTGVGQVLAILYVVLTSRSSKTIIIDEPNSFLHPGATRKLIELLKRDFPYHQYVISTHSPEVIRSTAPTSLTLVKWSATGSIAEQLSASDMRDCNLALSEVGVKMSDVFGAENIVWVEGPTEESSVHAILTKIAVPPRLNTSVIGVVNTGDFESKKLPLERVMNVYEKLSISNALIPPSIAFIFDTEGRSPREIEDLRRRGGGKIHFLPRRLFENYLLDPEAIHSLLKKYNASYGYEGTTEDIAQWIAQNGKDPHILDRKHQDVEVLSTQWFERVHGANLLKKLFEHFVGSLLPFSKTTHSVAICDWLIENKPVYLQELKEFLEGTMPHEA